MRSRLTRWMMWMGLAAVAMYFMDPDQGKARRREFRTKIESYRKAAERTKVQTSI